MNSIQPLSNPRKLLCEHRQTNSEVYIETLTSQHLLKEPRGVKKQRLSGFKAKRKSYKNQGNVVLGWGELMNELETDTIQLTILYRRSKISLNSHKERHGHICPSEQELTVDLRPIYEILDKRKSTWPWVWMWLFSLTIICTLTLKAGMRKRHWSAGLH